MKTEEKPAVEDDEMPLWITLPWQLFLCLVAAWWFTSLAACGMWYGAVFYRVIFDGLTFKEVEALIPPLQGDGWIGAVTIMPLAVLFAGKLAIDQANGINAMFCGKPFFPKRT